MTKKELNSLRYKLKPSDFMPNQKNEEWRDEFKKYCVLTPARWCPHKRPLINWVDCPANFVEDFIAAQIAAAEKRGKREGELRREKEILIEMDECEKEGWTLDRFIDSFAQIVDKNEREISNLKNNDQPTKN